MSHYRTPTFLSIITNLRLRFFSNNVGQNVPLGTFYRLPITPTLKFCVITMHLMILRCMHSTRRPNPNIDSQYEGDSPNDESFYTPNSNTHVPLLLQSTCGWKSPELYIATSVIGSKLRDSSSRQPLHEHKSM